MSVLHPRPQRRTTYQPVSPLHQVGGRSLTERLVAPEAASRGATRTLGALRGVVTAATALRLPKRSAL